MNGYNPIKWKCKDSGCYLKLVRPRIEVFADCFPRRINFTDIDFMVEIKGVFLMLEFKRAGPLPRGQKWMLENLTRLRRVCHAKTSLGVTVYLVTGSHLLRDDQEVQVTRFLRGEWDDVRTMTVSELKLEFAEWSKWAESPYRADDTHPIAEYVGQGALF